MFALCSHSIPAGVDAAAAHRSDFTPPLFNPERPQGRKGVLDRVLDATLQTRERERERERDSTECAVFAQCFFRSRASSTGRNVRCCTILFVQEPKSQLDGEKCAVFAQYFSFKSQLDGEECAVFAQYFSRSRAPLARAPFERFNERAAHRPKSRISYDAIRPSRMNGSCATKLRRLRGRERSPSFHSCH